MNVHELVAKLEAGFDLFGSPMELDNDGGCDWASGANHVAELALPFLKKLAELQPVCVRCNGKGCEDCGSQGWV